MTFEEANRLAAIVGGQLASTIAGMPILFLNVDGAIPIDRDYVVVLGKGSAAAMTIAVPATATQVGRKIVIIGGTDFAHVVTATGATVHDGTTGGHATLTSPAFQGGTLTLRLMTGSKWAVEANNLWVIT